MNRTKNQLKSSFREYFIGWLSPSGAILILTCFFLPWLEVRCSGKKIIGSGLTFANQAFPLWSIPILALVVILLFIWYQRGLPLKWFRIGSIVSASFGLFIMVLTYIGIEKKLSGFIIRKITSHQIKIGLIGTVIGFVLVIISSLLSKNRKTNT